MCFFLLTCRFNNHKQTELFLEIVLLLFFFLLVFESTYVYIMYEYMYSNAYIVEERETKLLTGSFGLSLSKLVDISVFSFFNSISNKTIH